MSLALKVLIALVLGLGAGLGASVAGPSIADPLATLLQPVGTIWVSAIRMAIIPLVVSSLLLGVGRAPDARTVGVLGARGLLMFLAMLTAAGLFSLAIAPMVFSRFHVDTAAAEALRASAVATGQAAIEGAKSIPSLAQWFIDLVPVNPVKAAADGALLPLIVFSIALGAALTRIAADRREALLRVMDAVQEACLAVMRAVLVVAPVGVFALAFVLAAKIGFAAAGALATYIVLVCAVCIAFWLVVLYPAAVFGGGVKFMDFARAILPAQAVAFSSRSSLAAFPAMLAVAREKLGLSQPTIGFLLPLMVTIFRAGAVIAQVVGAIFIAKLYGIPLSPAQYATMTVTSIAASFSVPGIPGGGILMMVPVLLSVGLPAEGVGILLAVDTIPDMFRTATNVTADLAAAVILDRRRVKSPAS